jgi:outer membrane lipoprotein-sorting protein
MTRWIPLLLCPALCMAAGCKSLGFPAKEKDPDAPKAAPAGERSAKDLVDYLNAKAALVQSISYKDVSVSVTENGSSYPRLGDSTLFAAKPNNFRLMAGHSLSSGEVDIGSNDREFWMHVKRLEGPNFFYCSHEDFARGVGKRFPIPMDPQWVMQALGLATYDPAGQYDIRTYTSKGKQVLEQKSTTVTGTPVRKIIAFNLDYDRGRKPVVAKHLIVDSQDQTIASAEIVGVKSIEVKPKQWVQVPTEVVLEYPPQKVRMRLVLGQERVNDDFRQRPELFQRPSIRGSNPIDLATYNFNPTSFK